LLHLVGINSFECIHIPYDTDVWDTAFPVQLIVAGSGTIIFRNVGNY